MRITCFITVCACLSSTVSSDEIKHLNRIRKVRSQEEVVLKSAPPGREINPIPELYPNEPHALRGSRTPVRIETFSKSRKTREFQSGIQQQQQQQQQQQKQQQQQQQQQQKQQRPQYQKQQQQYRHYNHSRPKRVLKRLKTRSVFGASLDLDDNHLTELGPESIHEVHDEDSVHIEPVLRVTKKHSVFDSIIDILRQLLYPSKNEPGPLVGPIKIPGSGRKIYVRLIEPVDASQVLVRFITQVPVPTVDTEHKPVFHIPPVIHPANVLLHYSHGHGHEHVPSGSEIHPDSSNRFRVIHSPPRNVNFSRAPNKQQGPSLHNKPVILPSPTPAKSPSSVKDLPGNVSDTNGKDKPPKEPEPTKSEVANTQVKPTIPAQQFPLDSSDSYYQYESAEKIVKDLLNGTAGNADSGTKVPAEPWYQLNTYRLPLRQVAPLYPLSSMEDKDPPSLPYEDTYKVPSDVLTSPSSYSSSSYEHYNNANSAPGFSASSYEHYSAPSSYSTSYDSRPNDDVSGSFSNSYQPQNEFNGSPSSYSTSYGAENNFGSMPSSYSTSSETLNDLLSAPSSYSSSYERGIVPPSLSSYDSSRKKQNGVRAISRPHATSYEKENDGQTDSISHDALHVIDPPFFSSHPRQPSANQNADESFERTTIRQPRYNPHSINDVIANIKESGESSVEASVIWGEAKQQENESPASFQKSLESSSEVEDSNESWHPLIVMHENADWHKVFADLMEGTRNGNYREATKNQQQQQQQQQQQRQQQQRQQRPRQQQKLTDWPRKTTNERGKRRDQRQNSAKVTTQSSRCLSEDETVGCERTKTMTISIPRSEKTRIVVETQTAKSIIDSIVEAVPESVATSNAIEKDIQKLDDTTKIVSTSTTSSITERPLPLIRTTKSPAVNSITEKPSLLIKITKTPLTNSITEKPLPLIRTTVASGKLKSMGDKKEVSAGLTSSISEEAESTTSTPSSTTRKSFLPKRPMIMKKPTLIIKKFESSTTHRPAVSGTTTKRTLTTKRTFTTRKSKFRSMIARTKSNTT